MCPRSMRHVTSSTCLGLFFEPSATDLQLLINRASHGCAREKLSSVEQRDTIYLYPSCAARCSGVESVTQPVLVLMLVRCRGVMYRRAPISLPYLSIPILYPKRRIIAKSEKNRSTARVAQFLSFHCLLLALLYCC
jgi:hypothetical protein